MTSERPDSNELEAARRMMGADAPTARAEDAGDAAAVERVEAEMAGTVAALRMWRDGHRATLPDSQEIEADRKWLRDRGRVWRVLWIGGLAAAAAAAAIVVMQTTLFQPPKPEPSLEVAGAGEFGWSAPLPGRESGPVQSVAMSFRSEPEGGGIAGGGPGSIKGRGSDGQPSDSTDPAGEMSPAARGFVGQFSFGFRIPATLPATWVFVRGRPLAADRVQLIYESGEQRLDVFLTPSVGADVAFKTIQRDGVPVVTGRRHGIAMAFRGGVAAPEIWNKAADEFTLKKKD